MRLLQLLAGLTTAVVLLVSCGESERSNDSISITNDWVEASVPGRDYTPAYVTIRSDERDVLLDANVDGDVAEHAFLFMTHGGGDPARYSSHTVEPGVNQRLFLRSDREFKQLSQAEKDNGRFVPQAVNGGPTAEQVDEIEIDPRRPNADYLPEGGVPMHSSGYYIMLTGLSKPLKVGEPIRLELEFEKAGMVEVDTEVREQDPRASQPATRSLLQGKKFTLKTVEGRTDFISFKHRTFDAQGCNGMSGEYVVKRGFLSFSRFGSTTAACLGPGRMKFDRQLEQLVRHPALAGVRGHELILRSGNEPLLVLEEAPTKHN